MADRAAFLLLMILKSQIKREWAFSNMVSVIRQHLMSYINAGSFFENPEKAWQELIEEQKARQKGMTDQYSLFLNGRGLTFRNSRKTGLKAREIVIEI